MKVAVIDGDSIAYIIGYTFRDAELEGMVVNAVDDFVTSIFGMARNVTHYVGFLANRTSTCFRKELSATMERGYKAQRPERPEWYTRWAPIINKRLMGKWGFIAAVDGYEADDMIAYTALKLKAKGIGYVICGVDKDLKQVPGEHYNYSKAVTVEVSEEEAHKNFWCQVMKGDTSDNIRGLHKCGDKTAEKYYKEDNNLDSNMAVKVMERYMENYGELNGIRNFYTTYMLIKLHDEEIVNKFPELSIPVKKVNMPCPSSLHGQDEEEEIELPVEMVGEG